MLNSTLCVYHHLHCLFFTHLALLSKKIEFIAQSDHTNAKYDPFQAIAQI
jgi:hypothetical protein